MQLHLCLFFPKTWISTDFPPPRAQHYRAPEKSQGCTKGVLRHDKRQGMLALGEQHYKAVRLFLISEPSAYAASCLTGQNRSSKFNHRELRKCVLHEFQASLITLWGLKRLSKQLIHVIIKNPQHGTWQQERFGGEIVAKYWDCPQSPKHFLFHIPPKKALTFLSSLDLEKSSTGSQECNLPLLEGKHIYSPWQRKELVRPCQRQSCTRAAISTLCWLLV